MSRELELVAEESMALAQEASSGSLSRWLFEHMAICIRRALERAKAEAATEAKPEYAVRYFKPHGLHEGLPCPRCTEVVRDPLRHWSQSEGWACLQSLATSPPPPKPAAGEERPCARCGQPEPAANHHGDLFDDHPYEPPAPSPTSELVCGRCGAPIEGIRCSRWRDGCQGGASEAKPKPTSAASDGVACARCDDNGYLYDPGCSKMVACHCAAGIEFKREDEMPAQQNEHVVALRTEATRLRSPGHSFVPRYDRIAAMLDSAADTLERIAGERDKEQHLHKLDHSLADQWQERAEKAEADRDAAIAALRRFAGMAPEYLDLDQGNNRAYFVECVEQAREAVAKLAERE